MEKKRQNSSSESVEETKFQQTGVTNRTRGFSTRDLLYISILGVVGGIVVSVLPLDALIKIWYPFEGGIALVSGQQVIWFALVFGFSKKFGAATASSFIKGVVEFIFANNLGAFVIAIDLLEGFIVDLILTIAMKYHQEDTKLAWALACGLSCLLQMPVVWLLNGKLLILPLLISLTAFDFAFISGILFGLLGKLVRDNVIRAGVPVPFSIPAEIAPETMSHEVS